MKSGSGFTLTSSLCFFFAVYCVCCQEAVQDAVKRCTVQGEPAGRWDFYSTTLVSPAASAVSPLDVKVDVLVERSWSKIMLIYHSVNLLHQRGVS